MDHNKYEMWADGKGWQSNVMLDIFVRGWHSEHGTLTPTAHMLLEKTYNKIEDAEERLYVVQKLIHDLTFFGISREDIALQLNY